MNDQAMRLTGHPAQAVIIVPSTLEPLQISASGLAPKATGLNASSAFNRVKANLNLDSCSTVSASPWVNGGVPSSTTASMPDPQAVDQDARSIIADAGQPALID